MMKLLFSLFALMGFVAAEVPAFSAADDYDELNLNIRMLEGHGNTTTNEVVPEAGKTYTMKVPVKMTVPFASADAFLADATAVADMEGAFAGTVGVAMAKITDAVAATVSRARKLQESVELVITFTIEVAGDKVDAIKASIADPDFNGSLETAIKAAGIDVSGVSASAPEVAEKEASSEEESAPTAAPTAAASDPAAASNSVMMSANIALIAAAALSSFF